MISTNTRLRSGGVGVRAVRLRMPRTSGAAAPSLAWERVAVSVVHDDSMYPRATRGDLALVTEAVSRYQAKYQV